MGGFIQNQNASLAVSGSSKTLEVPVETTAKVLKGQLDGITVRVGGFVNRACKCGGRLVGTPQNVQNAQYHALSLYAGHVLPWFCTT